MKPTHRHIYSYSYPTKTTDGIVCGDTRKTEYISDNEYTSLPECVVCFAGKPKKQSNKPKVQAVVKRRLTLRDYLR